MKCPRVKIDFGSGGKSTIRFRLEGEPFEEPKTGNRRVPNGFVIIKRRTDGHYSVTAAQMMHGQRMGYGTCLYEAAAKYVCGKGRQLFSDTERSVDSDGFWAKQARKGRAQCVRCGSHETRAEARFHARSTGPNYCRSGCKRWMLKPCETTLSGRKRKR